MAANTDSVHDVQAAAEISHEPKRSLTTFDVDEDEAIRKVNEATTPSKDVQQGIRNVEAVTLAWTRTSLICAFAW